DPRSGRAPRLSRSEPLVRQHARRRRRSPGILSAGDRPCVATGNSRERLHAPAALAPPAALANGSVGSMVRLRPPSQPGSTLALPATADWPALLQQNQERLASASHSVAGMPLAEFRQLARRDALGFSAEYLGEFGQDIGAAAGNIHQPVVVTGHQPDLFH